MPPKYTPTPEASEPKRFTIGLRVGKAARERLEDAATASGRSLSQETEIRIERSFDQEDFVASGLRLKYGDEFAKVIAAAADAGLRAGRTYGVAVARDFTDGAENWHTYPTAFKAAIDAMQEVLMACRPVGGMKERPAVNVKAPREIAQEILDARMRSIVRTADSLTAATPSQPEKQEDRIERMLLSISDRLTNLEQEGRLKNLEQEGSLFWRS